jgi:serine/threonine protein kinase
LLEVMAMSLEGQHIGRYHLVRLLGSGGMGEVYLAEDAAIQRQIAIKVMRAEASPYPHASSTQEAARLFQREARAIALLDHPHILPLYDYGEMTTNEATIAYLVMPYRPEGSLVFWLRQQSRAEPQGYFLTTQDVAHIVEQAAEALQHAHNHQIVHQDVKPANFLIRSNQEKPHRPDLLLADFGIARFTNATASASQNVRGTPTYMAPEQLEGHAVPASDQYGLAIMTYELLTGRSPFQGGLSQVMYQHLHTPPAPPTIFNPHIPPDVNTVILCALAKKPEERFQTISAFAHAFQQAMQSTDAPTMLIERSASTSEMQLALAISDVEAAHGTVRNVTLPGGHQVNVVVPAGAYDGQRIRLEGQDFSSGSKNTGAVLVTLTITPTAKNTIIPKTEAVMITDRVLPREVPNASSRRRAKGWMILGVALALLVAISSVGFALLYVMANKTSSGADANRTNNTPSQTHSTVSTSSTSNPGSTPSASLDPYTHTGTLVLSDTLQDNSQNVDWMTGTNQNNATCQFTGGAYQSSQPVNGDFHACFALNSDYRNFVYEVQMTIVSGYAGGIIFRGNQAKSTFYYFRVGQDGSYDLRAYVDPLISDSHLLVSGTSPAIQTGYDHPNIIAVVANGSSLTFYANHQLITTVNDSTFSQGQIGVVSFNQGGLATVVYNNVNVWQL